MNSKRLIEELDRRVKFHRDNQCDPHGIGTAVMVALQEVKAAIEAITDIGPCKNCGSPDQVRDECTQTFID